MTGVQTCALPICRRGGGVGLPLSRQLVEAHGGTIRIESEIGRGTSVFVSLPLGEEAAAA